MKYYKKITGERLYLSPINEMDAETYTRWLNDSAVADGLGFTGKTVSLRGEEAWVADSHDRPQFAIVTMDEDRLIGNCGIQALDQLRQTCEVGVFIGEAEDRCKGYGAEALRLLLDYAFNSLNLRSAMLKVFSFNEQAIACYKKVGFREIGYRRQSYFLKGKFHDELFMDILREEFLV